MPSPLSNEKVFSKYHFNLDFRLSEYNINIQFVIFVLMRKSRLLCVHICFCVAFTTNDLYSSRDEKPILNLVKLFVT